MIPFQLKNGQKFEVPSCEFAFVREKILNNWAQIQADNSELQSYLSIPAGTIIECVQLENSDQSIIRLYISPLQEPVQILDSFQEPPLSHQFLIHEDASTHTPYCGAISRKKVMPEYLIYDFLDPKGLEYDDLDTDEVYSKNTLQKQHVFGINSEGKYITISFSRSNAPTKKIQIKSYDRTNNSLIEEEVTIQAQDLDDTINRLLYKYQFSPFTKDVGTYAFLPEPEVTASVPLLVMPYTRLTKSFFANIQQRHDPSIERFFLINDNNGCTLFLHDLGCTIDEQLLAEKNTPQQTDFFISHLKMAQRCCDVIQQYHQKGLLVVNLYSGNFFAETGTLIDFSGVISKDRSEPIVKIPPNPKYYPPEWNYSDPVATESSDVFSLGQVLDDIFTSDDDIVTNSLCKMMTYNIPSDRLSAELASEVLENYIEALESGPQKEYIADFFRLGFETFYVSLIHDLNKNKKNAMSLLKLKIARFVLLMRNTKNDDTFLSNYLAQQTFIALIDNWPHYTKWIASQNLNNLSNSNEKCVAILGSLAYIKESNHFFSKGRKRMTAFIKSLCEEEVTENNNITSYKKQALKGSSKKENSREKILSRFEIFLSSEQEKIVLSQYKILIKMAEILGKTNNECKAIIQHQNFELIKKILLVAIEYMEMTKKSYFHGNGRRQVKDFMKKICATDFLDNNHDDHISNEIKQEREKLIYGRNHTFFTNSATNNSLTPLRTIRAKMFTLT